MTPHPDPSTLDLEGLKKFALAATPGPWFWALDHNKQPTSLMRSGVGDYVVCPQADIGDYGLSVNPWNDVSDADAKYIETVVPETVLALISRIRLLEEEKAASRQALLAAKREMWSAARHEWTLDDFNNWAVIQQINAALRSAGGGGNG